MNTVIETWNWAAAVWWDWTVTATWQGMVLLFGFAILLSVHRSLRPGIRYVLLLILLLKLTVPPFIGVAFGYSDLLDRLAQKSPVPPIDVPAAVVEVERGPVSNSGNGALAEPYTTAAAGEWPGGIAWLLALECAGGLALLGWIGMHLQRNQRALRAATRADSALQLRFRRIAAEVGVRRVPRLLVSERMTAPQAGGVFHPYVVLPPWVLTMPDGALRVLLAHELTHVKRGDALVNAMQGIAQVVQWWNPVVWWLNREIRIQREFCCDTFVLELGLATPVDYSRALVAVAEQVSCPGPAWATSGMANGYGAIERRIQSALATGPVPGKWARGLAALLLIALCCWILPGVPSKSEAYALATETPSETGGVRPVVVDVTPKESGSNAALPGLPANEKSGANVEEALASPQIKVSARILEVDLAAAEELLAEAGAPLRAGQPADSPAIQQRVQATTILGESWPRIERLVAALVESKRAKLVSAPAIITPNGEEAVITIGTEVPYKDGDAVSFEKLGTSLRILPRLDTSQGLLNLEYSCERSVQTGLQDGKPVVATRKSETKVDIKAGQDVWLMEVEPGAGDKAEIILIHPEVWDTTGK